MAQLNRPIWLQLKADFQYPTHKFTFGELWISELIPLGALNIPFVKVCSTKTARVEVNLYE